MALYGENPPFEERRHTEIQIVVELQRIEKQRIEEWRRARKQKIDKLYFVEEWYKIEDRNGQTKD